MYLSIIFLPLLGSIVSGFFGRKTGIYGSQILTSLCIIITTILAIISFIEVGINNNSISINLFKWLNSESFNLNIGFQFDSLTVSMLLPVLIISSLVHIYSISYMGNDPHNQRFFSYLSLFTFMMIILVTANNFVIMFVGWEGVGVCSYLLVSFWFTRIAANQSSLSAFLTNRVGDCFLTLGMLAIAWCFGNLDYVTVFSLAPYINENIVTIIGICLLIGAMAKSAQLGLHIWLPQAMEGPTPVSALIHAATMVTAGVYLLMRSSLLIEYSSTVLLLCLWLGAITTVFSSLVGLFQSDIKKIIAYSTMSQLGLMVVAIGLSSYNVALFHLVNHAFYKAALFLGAGSVIHSVADNQDLRRMGGLISFLPLTYSVMLIASCSLAAFPFLTGFYSKDFILESSYGQFTFSGSAIYTIATIGAIFTVLYSVKILYLAFLSPANGPKISYKNAHEGDLFMIFPLVVLAIFSIIFGYFTKEIFLGMGTGFFIDNSIFIHPNHEIMIVTEYAVATIFKLLPFILTLAFIFLAIITLELFPEIVIKFKLTKLGYYVFGFFNQRFLIEFFYNKYIVNVVFNLGGHTTKIIDKGAIELVGPLGIEKILIKCSKFITSQSRGIVTDYALFMVLGLVFLITGVYSLDIKIILFIILILVGLLYNEGKKDENRLPFWVNSNMKSNLLSLVNFEVNNINTPINDGSKYIITYCSNNDISSGANGERLDDLIVCFPKNRENKIGSHIIDFDLDISQIIGWLDGIIACFSIQDKNMLNFSLIFVIFICITILILKIFPEGINPVTGLRYPILIDPEVLREEKIKRPWELKDEERLGPRFREKATWPDKSMPGRLGKPTVFADGNFGNIIDTPQWSDRPVMEPPMVFENKKPKPDFKNWK